MTGVAYCRPPWCNKPDAALWDTADRGKHRQAAGRFAKVLIPAVQFLGRIAVSVHNTLNRVIAAGRNSTVTLCSDDLPGRATSRRLD